MILFLLLIKENKETMSPINNCTFCGTEISSEFTYCPKCGNKQTNENVQVSNEIDPIVHCGNEYYF